MGPRSAGAGLILLSLAAGVVAGWLISRAPWSIPAALLVTAATVGMGVDALWTLRTSWADKTWPPTGADLSDSVRARRRMRTLGIMLLAPVPVAVTVFVWALVDGGTRWDRLLLLALFVMVYAALGVGIIGAGRSSASASLPRSSHTQHPPDTDASTTDAGGWRPLGQPANGWMLVAGLGPTAVLAVVIPMQLLLIVDEAPWGIALWAIAVGIAAGAGIIVLRRASRRVEIDVAGERIRAGRRAVPWSELTRAELFAEPPWSGAARTLMVVLGDDNGLRARLVLRRREDLALSAAETDLVLRVIDASSIALPRAKEDPRGRFSKQLYPNSLTKEEAFALVAKPPAMHEALPIG